jgi:hypothetical protein
VLTGNESTFFSTTSVQKCSYFCLKMKLFFYLPSPLNQSQTFFFTYFLFSTNHTPSLIILTYFLNTRANLKNAYILGWRKYMRKCKPSTPTYRACLV